MIKYTILKLLLAFIIGGIIGLEREFKGMTAGLRTHILVCLGATLVQIISLNYHTLYGIQFDPMRLGAQVISGIGFLGAGAIIKDGITPRGLTTAASIWVVGCVGLAIGSGFYIEALITTILILISLVTLKKLEEKISKFSNK